MSAPALPVTAPDTITQANFERLEVWGASEVIQRSHVDVTLWAVTNIAAGGNQDITVTFANPFAPGVTPMVLCSINSTQTTLTDSSDNCTMTAYNKTNTGCTVRVKNQGAGALGSGTVKLIVMAIDSTYSS